MEDPISGFRQRSGSGIVKRVRLENFMCHSSLQIELGDWVNFITGQNGSKPSYFSRYVDVCASIGSVKFMLNPFLMWIIWSISSVFCKFGFWNLCEYQLIFVFLVFVGGKSAILTALCVAFGCRAKGTQRASTLKDFIKTGCRLVGFDFFLFFFF